MLACTNKPEKKILVFGYHIFMLSLTRKYNRKKKNIMKILQFDILKRRLMRTNKGIVFYYFSRPFQCKILFESNNEKKTKWIINLAQTLDNWKIC